MGFPIIKTISSLILEDKIILNTKEFGKSSECTAKFSSLNPSPTLVTCSGILNYQTSLVIRNGER